MKRVVFGAVQITLVLESMISLADNSASKEAAHLPAVQPDSPQMTLSESIEVKKENAESKRSILTRSENRKVKLEHGNRKKN